MHRVGNTVRHDSQRQVFVFMDSVSVAMLSLVNVLFCTNFFSARLILVTCAISELNKDFIVILGPN